MVMFDSLNRRLLPPYGCDWTCAPNFARLARRSVTFDNAFVGSMPCMPARRELHTGRHNFLHRSWGPMEPFDDSMPEILRRNGVASHLISDHYHYWEDGGATYHTRFSTWELSRGQEGDPWKCELADPVVPENVNWDRGKWARQDWINRSYMKRDEDTPQARTFGLGLEFLEKNHDQDNWFLQLETFDPHEPFFAHEEYRDLYPREYGGPLFDWPNYAPVREPDDRAQELRYRYAALLSKCDHHLGTVLDFMDRHDMWRDTMLIVNTDHGFLLGEHGWWAKCAMPFYHEIAHTPLFVWDPRSAVADERRQALVQTIDLAPTLLEFFGMERPPDMQGIPLRQTLVDDTPVRQAALYGMFGGHVNCTDGRYVYMRAPVRPDNQPLSEYTLMTTRHGSGGAFMFLENLRRATLAPAFGFTKGCPLLKVPSPGSDVGHRFGTLLFDLESDPGQLTAIDDSEAEARMCGLLRDLMVANEAPAEQFERLGLAVP
jgi:arylsulfatase A-like enzyme